LRNNPAMRRPPAVLVSLALAASGCAALFHKPRPDLELDLAERPWRVRCAWVLPPAAERGASPAPRGDGWSWAGDEAGRRLVVTGRIEDGFFVVDSVRAASDRDDRDVLPYGATARDVRRACNVALDRAVEGEQPRLYAVSAVRDGEGVEVPMVFPADPALPRPVSRVVVFGDSLSDPGNLKRRLLVFPNSPYWFGRFANGPNWTEYLADRTGLAVQNQAYGGAAAVKHEDVPSEDIVAAIQQGAQFFLTGSLDRQVNDYLERDLSGGAVTQPSEIAYVIWGGANDYISKEPFSGDIGTLLDDPEGRAGYRRIVKEAVAALADQVRRLHGAGARQFVVLNLPNLGKTPIVLQNESYTPFGHPPDPAKRRLRLSAKLGELTAYHNGQLANAVTRLRRELPEARLVSVDTAKLVDQILAARAPDGSGRSFDYGFALRELESTVGAGRERRTFQKRCYSGGYLGSLSASSVCSEAASAMFWDVVHPTSYTHCWVAYFVQRELAAAGLAAAPESVSERRAYCISRTQPDW
jgi:phospholipase/lecithinase/hemolysin